MRNNLTRNRAATARAAGLVTVVAAMTVGLSACAGTGGGKDVNIAGFSVLKSANAAVIADFQKTADGKGVTFGQSYQASGTQARSVIAGQPADEVHLALEPDMAKVVAAGKVASTWNSGPNQGILTQSVVVLVVRKGNPDHITGWDDLAKPGIKIVTPNPGSSGSAKWNILAAYGSQIAEGKSASQAKAYLQKVVNNVVSWPSSASDATSTFVSGNVGDVEIAYESDAIAARRAGAAIDYVVPSTTLLIQEPGAVTKTASKDAKNFLAYQLSPAGQKVYAEYGFRPLASAQVTGETVKGAEDPSNPYPTPAKLLTIDDSIFGGWTAANTFFFGNSGLATTLIAATGKS